MVYFKHIYIEDYCTCMINKSLQYNATLSIKIKSHKICFPGCLFVIHELTDLIVRVKFIFIASIDIFHGIVKVNKVLRSLIQDLF